MPSVRNGHASWIVMTFSLTCVGFLLAFGVSWTLFGSPAGALAYFRGDRLIPDHLEGSFGELGQGQRAVVKFGLTNASGKEIRVLGAKTECTCIFADELPLSVPPGRKRTINVAVRTESREGSVRESIRLFTDCPRQPELQLLIVGHVSPSVREGDKRVPN